MKNALLIIIATIVLTSCSLVQAPSFNKDNSGTYQVYMDLKEFKKKMGKMPKKDAGKNPFSEKSEAMGGLSMMEYVAQTEGISNIKEINDTVAVQMGFSFDFDSPKSLNTVLNRIEYHNQFSKDSTATLKAFNYYTFDGKQLFVKNPQSKKESKEESDKGLDKMEEMLTLKWKMNFKKKLKKVESKYEYKFDSKAKSVEISISSKELREATDDNICTITFK